MSMAESTDKSASPSGVSGVASTTEVDLDVIKARAAIRPGALLTALRCVPDGEVRLRVHEGLGVHLSRPSPRHGCVISDGTQTKDAIRAAYHVVHKDVPVMAAEIERLRALVKAANWCDCGIGPSRDGLCDNSALATQPHAEECPARDRVLVAEVAQLRETLRGLLAFYDAALDSEDPNSFDAALDAAEPHAEAARALLAGDQS